MGCIYCIRLSPKLSPTSTSHQPPATYTQVSIHIYIYSQTNSPPLYKSKTLTTLRLSLTHTHPYLFPTALSPESLTSFICVFHTSCCLYVRTVSQVTVLFYTVEVCNLLIYHLMVWLSNLLFYIWVNY